MSHVLANPASIEWFKFHAIGATMPNLNEGIIRLFPMRLPPLEDQQTTAALLSALDDKIDLNLRTNETLEAMARAVFKDWFIDYGPTRAKMEGRTPYLEPDIWALFPDRLDEEGKPDGWNWTVMSQHVSVTKGKSYKSEELRASTTALVTLKSFARGGGYRRDGLKPFCGNYKPDQVVSEGEIVVAQTDVTQAADVIGRPARVVADRRFDRLVASLDVAIIRPMTTTYVGSEFFLRLMGCEAFTQHTYAHTSGTTVLHLGRNAIQSFPFALPPPELTKGFHEPASALAARQLTAAHENDMLIATRDLLVPKLMSGEFRVKEAAKVVEATL
jgi:type I restriction enzyme S subunit